MRRKLRVMMRMPSASTSGEIRIGCRHFEDIYLIYMLTRLQTWMMTTVRMSYIAVNIAHEEEHLIALLDQEFDART